MTRECQIVSQVRQLAAATETLPQRFKQREDPPNHLPDLAPDPDPLFSGGPRRGSVWDRQAIPPGTSQTGWRLRFAE